MVNNVKYYIGSDGVAKDISTIETTHLTNALAKKYREIFESPSKDDFAKRLEVITNLKDELDKRINKFYDGLGV